MDKVFEIIERRINQAKEDAKEAQSDMMYERAKGALYELEELLKELNK